jgi:D-alanine-D-alanine ligase
MTTNNISLSPIKPIKKIAILYSDAQRQYFPTEQLYITEVEVKGRAKLIAEILENRGFTVDLFPGDAKLHTALLKFKPDKVINLVDSVYGQEYLAGTIPATLELLQIPYTGSGLLAISINANKYLSKSLLEQYGVTTPKYQLIRHANDEIDEELDFPLFVKLNENHGSLEVSEGSVCFDAKMAKSQIDYLYKTYQQPILLEEFIAGREITVVLVDGGNRKIYAAEKIFHRSTDDPFKKIVTFDDNWLTKEDTITYEKYELPPAVKKDAKKAFNILKIEDYAKFDFRLDEAGRHYLIDVNVNPALGPSEHCAIGSILKIHGISFPSFLDRLVKKQDS